MTDLLTSSARRPRRRPRPDLRRGRSARSTERVVAAGRASDAAGLHADAMAREAQSATGLPGGSPSRTAAPSTSPSRRSPFARLDPGRRLRREGRPGRPGLPDRRPGGRRQRAPQAALRARPLAGQARLHRPPCARPPTPTRSSRSSSPRWRPPTAAAAAAHPDSAPRSLRQQPPAQRSRSSPSPPARPASRTPTWRPTPWSPPASGPASTWSSRRRGRPARRRSTRPSSPAPTPSSSPPTSGVKDRRALRRQAGRRLRRQARHQRARRDDRRGRRAPPTTRRRPRRWRRHRGGAAAEPGGVDLPWGVRLRQILLTGVSYMIPFVAAGGLLIALGFLLGGYEITDGGRRRSCWRTRWRTCRRRAAWRSRSTSGAVLFKLGALAFGFLVPALAGYIAFAIADRPGLAPGFTAGAIAGLRRRGLHRRSRRRSARRLRRAVDQPARACRCGSAG